MGEIITPVGTKLLVFPTEMKEHVTDTQIVVVQNDLRAATVIEVGTEVKNVYKKGQVVIYPKNTGVGQMYRGKAHFWLDGRPVNSGGDVWGIIENEPEKKDKGDGL